MYVLLVNRDCRGQMQPVSGKSGKLYGQATYDANLGGAVFRMSLEDYTRDAHDIAGNPAMFQQWVPLFCVTEDEKSRDGVLVLGADFAIERLDESVVMLVRQQDHVICGTRVSIDLLQSLAGDPNPDMWFRLIKRGEDGVTTVESKLVLPPYKDLLVEAKQLSVANPHRLNHQALYDAVKEARNALPPEPEPEPAPEPQAESPPEPVAVTGE